MNIDLPSKLLKLIKTVKLDMILLSMQGKYNKLPVASVMLRCINILKNRPATHPDLIGISQFFSTNLGVSRFHDSTCENPEFLFRFEMGKTEGRLTLLHGPCLQTHKVWTENKC